MKSIVYLLSIFNLTLFFSCDVPSPGKEHATSSLQKLVEGNDRYKSFHPVHPDQTKERLKSITDEQHPFAVIVSCSDSRVPPELIFDQGLGDLFVIRTAGNIIGEYEIASIEYAVEKLHAKTVIVLGHEKCGAIKACMEGSEYCMPGHLNLIVDYIRNEPEEEDILDKKIHTVQADAEKANILHAKHVICNSNPLLKEKVNKKKLEMLAGYYHLADGHVEWLVDK
jgi:carbonic anhydrase